MNTTLVTGNWYKQKGKLKQRFAAFTRDLFLFEEGREEEIFGKLQIKLSRIKSLPFKTFALSKNFGFEIITKGTAISE
jgi:hypothetical protein